MTGLMKVYQCFCCWQEARLWMWDSVHLFCQIRCDAFWKLSKHSRAKSGKMLPILIMVALAWMKEHRQSRNYIPLGLILTVWLLPTHVSLLFKWHRRWRRLDIDSWKHPPASFQWRNWVTSNSTNKASGSHFITRKKNLVNQTWWLSLRLIETRDILFSLVPTCSRQFPLSGIGFNRWKMLPQMLHQRWCPFPFLSPIVPRCTAKLVAR